MKKDAKVIDYDLKLLDAYIRKRRPPEEIRDKLDIGYTKEGQVIEIYTIRPHFQDASKKIKSEVARAKYIKSRSVWRLYWMRANMKWYFYEESGEMTHLSQVLDVIEADVYGCFWG